MSDPKHPTVQDIKQDIEADRGVWLEAHKGRVVSVPLPTARKMIEAIEQMAREHGHHFIPGALGRACYGCLVLEGVVDWEQVPRAHAEADGSPNDA